MTAIYTFNRMVTCSMERQVVRYPLMVAIYSAPVSCNLRAIKGLLAHVQVSIGEETSVEG